MVHVIPYTMGRKKIQIVRINDERNRQVMYLFNRLLYSVDATYCDNRFVATATSENRYIIVFVY